MFAGQSCVLNRKEGCGGDYCGLSLVRFVSVEISCFFLFFLRHARLSFLLVMVVVFVVVVVVVVEESKPRIEGGETDGRW